MQLISIKKEALLTSRKRAYAILSSLRPHISMVHARIDPQKALNPVSGPFAGPGPPTGLCECRDHDGLLRRLGDLPRV